jgi:hypothetical protein
MSINSFKFGLVIQGPIHSTGFSGATWCSKHGEINKDNVHNASSDIVSSYLEAKKFFDEVVIITWSTEDTSEIENFIVVKDLIKLDPRRFEREINENSYPASSKNTKKQFFTTLEGLKVLMSRGCDISAKQRSDIKLDVFQLHTFLSTEAKALERNRIIIPLVNLKSLNWIQDFYFGGRTSTLISWSESVLNKKDFYLTSHKDIFYKLSLLNAGRLLKPLGLSLLDFFPSDTANLTSRQSRVLQEVWENQLKLFPMSIWKNLVWRGASMSGCLDKHPEQAFEPPSKTFFESKVNSLQALCPLLRSTVARDMFQYLVGSHKYNSLRFLLKREI